MNGLDGIRRIIKKKVDKESSTKVALSGGVNYTSGFVRRNLSDFHSSKSQHSTICVACI